MFDSTKAIAVYRGWDELEKRTGTGVEIVDFDLVTQIPGSEEFDSRAQVLTALRRLRDEVEVRDEITEFIRAKLNASVYYLKVLDGDLPDFYEHVRTITGVTPELVSREVQEAHRAQVLSLLEQNGVKITCGTIDPESFAEFDRQLWIDADQAMAEAHDLEDELLPKVKEILGWPDLEVPFHTEPAEVKNYWTAWSSGEKGDFLLRYNFHPMVVWRRGDMEYLTLHEVCGHFVHAACMAREIEQGRLNPFIGITTVHDPHSFMGEGIADSLTYFFPEELGLSPWGQLSLAQRNWKDHQFNNAHILINMGWSKEELRAELLTNPFNAPTRVDLNLQQWPSHPLMRAYQYSYGIALKYHQRWAAQMTFEQKVEYLRYAFSRYVTPRRLIQKAESILA